MRKANGRRCYSAGNAISHSLVGRIHRMIPSWSRNQDQWWLIVNLTLKMSRTNINEIWSEVHTLSFTKIHLKCLQILFGTQFVIRLIGAISFNNITTKDGIPPYLYNHALISYSYDITFHEYTRNHYLTDSFAWLIGDLNPRPSGRDIHR